MAAQKTITINGRLYDAVTGLPVAGNPTPSAPQASAAAPAKKVSSPSATQTAARAVKPAPTRSRTASEAIHGTVQKSKTLMRRATKKPVAPQKIVRRAQPGRHMDIARSASVSKFAAHPVVKPAAAKASRPLISPDTPAQVHPSAARALGKLRPKQAAAPVAKKQTAKQVKEQEISKAIAAPKQKTTKKPTNKWVRRAVIVGSCVLVLAAVLFAIYKFVPSISVSIAASQAGIEARYPDYTPDGYALNQPVTYSDGEVNLQFKSNSNDSSYTITQKRSSWDSTAVLDSVVKTAVGENYTTTKERGLTIYTFDKGAAWVNGGILYTIRGDAPLSGDQIRRLATSL
jgi:hypothetical protein